MNEIKFNLFFYVLAPLAAFLLGLLFDCMKMKNKRLKDGQILSSAINIVTDIEKELGSGNGGMKLRCAVAKLIMKFSGLAEAEAYAIINKAWYLVFESGSVQKEILK